MNSKIEAIQQLIKRLADGGIIVACVGGAARDVYLGREPKDYDFVVLHADIHDSKADRLLAIETATGYDAHVMTGSDDESCTESTGDGTSRGLDMVIESGIAWAGARPGDWLTVQFLFYEEETRRLFGGRPELAVEQHDCDLNKAWFYELNGKLVARVHREFPMAVPGLNINRFRSSGVNADRIQYIMDKFPEYKHEVPL